MIVGRLREPSAMDNARLGLKPHADMSWEAKMRHQHQRAIHHQRSLPWHLSVTERLIVLPPYRNEEQRHAVAKAAFIKRSACGGEETPRGAGCAASGWPAQGSVAQKNQVPLSCRDAGHVRFPPLATKLAQRRNMSRRANNRLYQANDRLHVETNLPLAAIHTYFAGPLYSS